MRKTKLKAKVNTRSDGTVVLRDISAIRRRVNRKKKSWDSVKLLRAVRDGR